MRYFNPDRVTFALLGAMASAIFFLDVFSPLTTTWEILYALPVLWASSLPNRTALLALAGICTFLILTGTFFTHSTAPNWESVSNRGLAIITVWGMVGLLRWRPEGFAIMPASGASVLREEQKRLRHLFGERVKELTALHRAVRLLQDSARPVEAVLSQIVALLPPAWQYPEITVARITFEGVAVTTPIFAETPWSQTASWATADGGKGRIEVIYLEERPPESEGPFLAEERDLINSLADSLCSFLNRRRAELALREAHERLQALSQQLIEVQENERRHIAHDLHDEIGQLLTVVKMNLQTMQRLSDTAAIDAPLKDSLTVIDQTLQHVRDLSLDLRPSLLDDLGLAPAVRWYLNRQVERTGWHIDVAVEEPLPSLPQSVAISCFRIIQEAVTNIMRHSRATQVNVSLHQADDDLVVIVRDDGVGFDVREMLDKAARGESMGLLGMQERVRVLNGSLSVESASGQGTIVSARIPLSKASPVLPAKEST